MTPRTINFGKARLRALVSPDGSMWVAACDVYAAFHRTTDRAHLAHFAPDQLRLEAFSSENGPVRLTAVSLLGVATIAAALPFPQNRILDQWVRKLSRTLSAELGCAPLEWTLLADGRLPTKPKDTWDSYDDWFRLTMRHPRKGEPRYANLHEPALFDEDAGLPPHDPDADLPAFHAIRADLGTRDRLGESHHRLFRCH